MIQISDISAGLKNSINAFTPREETIIKKNQIWDNLFNKNTKLTNNKQDEKF